MGYIILNIKIYYYEYLLMVKKNYSDFINFIKFRHVKFNLNPQQIYFAKKNFIITYLLFIKSINFTFNEIYQFFIISMVYNRNEHLLDYYRITFLWLEIIKMKILIINLEKYFYLYFITIPSF